MLSSVPYLLPSFERPINAKFVVLFSLINSNLSEETILEQMELAIEQSEILLDSQQKNKLIDQCPDTTEQEDGVILTEQTDNFTNTEQNYD